MNGPQLHSCPSSDKLVQQSTQASLLKTRSPRCSLRLDWVSVSPAPGSKIKADSQSTASNLESKISCQSQHGRRSSRSIPKLVSSMMTTVLYGAVLYCGQKKLWTSVLCFQDTRHCVEVDQVACFIILQASLHTSSDNTVYI
jgi:hypothetical protein